MRELPPKSTEFKAAREPSGSFSKPMTKGNPRAKTVTRNKFGSSAAEFKESWAQIGPANAQARIRTFRIGQSYTIFSRYSGHSCPSGKRSS